MAELQTDCGKTKDQTELPAREGVSKDGSNTHCDAAASRPAAAISVRHLLNGAHEVSPKHDNGRMVESLSEDPDSPMKRRTLEEESRHVKEERPGRWTKRTSLKKNEAQGRYSPEAPRRQHESVIRRKNGRGSEEKRGRRKSSSRGPFMFNKALENILLAEGPSLGIEPSPRRLTTSCQQAPFCAFHNDEGHDTQNCRMLRKILTDRVAEGHLRQYVHLKDADKEVSPTSIYSDERVMVISGGIAAGEPCKEGRQKGPSHLRPAQKNLPSVEISKDDYRRAATPYDDDPLVIEIKVADLKVKRVLVDTWSSSDIISLQCLRKLRHNPEDIEKVYGPLVGFGGSIVRPIGSILLPSSIGVPPVTKEVVIRFIIVANLTTFNIILGRPTLNNLRAVIVPHLLMVKFVGSDGRVGSLYGNQQLAKDCYFSTLEPAAWGASPKGKEQAKPLASRRKTREIPTEHNAERRPEPVGAHYAIILDLADPSRTVPIGGPP
ncbi:uncharacterized protein [Spinacia oleracea]|uniref:Reverse transcriptase domain-containing protein n=1 Tax=Spinacia oleracea TaxID=3562 RepID=A0ABM3RVH8_SPIOL|nr:uncharacterized protein LOC130472492 [Spinacia oleracea]XP_056699640.1 uncharacterized protein LOC130472492 [Spinacia oleracea]